MSPARAVEFFRRVADGRVRLCAEADALIWAMRSKGAHWADVATAVATLNRRERERRNNNKRRAREIRDAWRAEMEARNGSNHR